MSTVPPSPARVLIVEDEAVTAMDLATELRRMGYRVCGIADTAEDALRTTLREHPHLILMDIRLAGGSDGIEAARSIRARHDAAVVFLSAHSDEDTLSRALEVSPFGYIIKPFRALELKVALDVALAKHFDEREAGRRMEELALTDPLTGLGNRRKFEDVMDVEWRRGQREQTPLGLVMLDIDNFKLFNDRHGHLAGDQCLRGLAVVLRSHCVRPADVVCRWGGEEFAAILPATAQAGADFLAGHLVRMVETSRIACTGEDGSAAVTVSAGAASALPAEGGDPAGLLKCADAALYHAKREGGNRFASAAEH